MKKLALIAVVALFALCSCKEEGINLTKQLPELEGEWLWTHTNVGGFVGVVYADQDKPLVIDFKANNTINVIYDGETIVRSATYTCEEASADSFGKYRITLPKEVRGKVAEKMGISESNIVVDGYLSLEVLNLSEPCLTLFITDVDGHDVGVEGGSDFHNCSCFEPNRIVLF